jgi:hypothetical protein
MKKLLSCPLNREIETLALLAEAALETSILILHGEEKLLLLILLVVVTLVNGAMMAD